MPHCPGRVSTRPAEEWFLLSLKIRSPRPDDGAPVWRLAHATPELDLNSPYAYLLLCRHHAETSVVAQRDDAPELAGFVLGYRPPGAPDALFVWQVAVADSERGQGLAGAMLGGLVERNPGIDWLETTVTPTNQASDRLFRSFAARRDAEVTTSLFASADDFPPEAGAHEDEIRYRIGPLAATSRMRPRTRAEELL